MVLGSEPFFGAATKPPPFLESVIDLAGLL